MVLHEPDVAAVLELTDVAPSAVRAGVRARATLGGWLSATGEGGLATTPTGLAVTARVRGDDS